MYSKKTLIFSVIGALLIGVFVAFISIGTMVSSLTGTSSYGMGKIVAALTILQTRYIQEVPPNNIVDGVIKGIASSTNDPHTAYMYGEAYKRLMADTKGEFSGIGALIGEKDGLPVIVSPIDDSPSATAGVKAGDKILKVDSFEVKKGTPIDEVVDKIRGTKGTPVVLLLLSEDGNTREVTIVRDIIKNKTVSSKMLEDDIGYVRIGQFSDNTPNDFSAALKELEGKGMKKLVLDLRMDPGGSLQACVEIAKHLVPKGLIVYTVDKSGKKQEFFSDLEKPKYKLAVLVDKGSASASEILAGAIQDTKAGTLIGTKTYGKGSVQAIIPLDKTSAFKVTIAKYFTPSGRSIDGIGIDPDIVIELDDKNIKTVDNQIEKAKETLKDPS